MASQVSFGKYRRGTPGLGYTEILPTVLPLARKRSGTYAESVSRYAYPPLDTFKAMLRSWTVSRLETIGSVRQRELS